MLSGLASLIFIPLLAISIVHMAWAFGATYPVKDEKMPPRLASFAVSLLSFAAGIWALALTDPSTSVLLTIGGVLLTLAFLGRGIFGYTKRWRELTPEEPFASLDKKIYSPLFIFIGTGFLILSALRIF